MMYSFADTLQIKPPAKDLVERYDRLADCPQAKIEELANKLCVLKLNGGLGTTMGCSGPKSVIEVHSELSFLDLTVHQIQVLIALLITLLTDHSTLTTHIKPMYH